MNIYQNTGEFIWQIKNFILNLHVSIKQGSCIYSQLVAPNWFGGGGGGGDSQATENI